MKRVGAASSLVSSIRTERSALPTRIADSALKGG
jgi:hypothetical protein